jgi:hypothetical protein
MHSIIQERGHVQCDRVVGDASIIEAAVIAADAGGDEPCG